MKDSYIKKFDAVYGSQASYYGFDLRKEFTEFFRGKDLLNRTALDLGCGEGRYSLFLAQKGCVTTAVDRSPAGIAKLKKMADINRLPIRAAVFDIEDFVFQDHQYDIIVAATVLDHLSDDLRHRIISGIQKALKPSGILYANVFTVSDPGFRSKITSAALNDQKNVSDTAECMEYYFEKNELKQAFGDLEVLYYYEGTEPDMSHGRPHDHGWACLLARKP
jgi:2-polyprenyl-3-methyl-5-hydroxy-6-metoxy-1,4-benzoquinol methylase